MIIQGFVAYLCLGIGLVAILFLARLCNLLTVTRAAKRGGRRRPTHSTCSLAVFLGSGMPIYTLAVGVTEGTIPQEDIRARPYAFYPRWISPAISRALTLSVRGIRSACERPSNWKHLKPPTRRRAPDPFVSLYPNFLSLGCAPTLDRISESTHGDALYIRCDSEGSACAPVAPHHPSHRGGLPRCGRMAPHDSPFDPWHTDFRGPPTERARYLLRPLYRGVSEPCMFFCS